MFGEHDPLLHAELHRLPAPAAPPTLLPRVLAAAQAWADRPWHARAWHTWPMAAQLAALFVLVSVASLVAVGTPALTVALADSPAAPLVSRLMAFTHDALAVRARLTTIVSAGEVLWRTVVQPIAPFAFALLGIMCAACAACAAAIHRVTVGRVAH
jgi:hypothetical protein